MIAPARATTRRSLLAVGVALLTSRRAIAAVDASRFGVKGDGITDDTDALQRAIAALGPGGGLLRLSAGLYIVSDRHGSGECLSATSGLRLIGDGPMQTVIRSRSPGADTLRIAPDPDWASDFTLVEGVFLGDNRTGLRVGRHGIYCETHRRGTALPHLTIRDCYIGQGSGAAVAHSNDPSANPNGGLYAASIMNCTLHGGVMLRGSGDSIVIRENIIGGGGFGIDAELIDGASLLSILDNNITSLNGAVRVPLGARINILRNNCEHQRRAPPGAVCIDIGGGGHSMAGGTIAQNLLSCFTGSGFRALIRLRDAVGTSIDANSFVAGDANVTGVVVGERCRGVRLGANTWNANVRPRFMDPGGTSVGCNGAGDQLTSD